MTTQCWGTIRLSLPLSRPPLCLSLSFWPHSEQNLHIRFTPCLDSVKADRSSYLPTENVAVQCLDDHLEWFSLPFSRFCTGRNWNYNPTKNVYMNRTVVSHLRCELVWDVFQSFSCTWMMKWPFSIGGNALAFTLNSIRLHIPKFPLYVLGAFMPVYIYSHVHVIRQFCVLNDSPKSVNQLPGYLFLCFFKMRDIILITKAALLVTRLPPKLQCGLKCGNDACLLTIYQTTPVQWSINFARLYTVNAGCVLRCCFPKATLMNEWVQPGCKYALQTARHCPSASLKIVTSQCLHWSCR